MKRHFFTILAATSLLGCAHVDLSSQPPFHPSIGIPEFQEWCAEALRQPDAAPAYHQFSLAYHGDRTALRAYFAEALKQCESPEIDAAGGEFLTWQLDTLLRRFGDQKFAAILATEPPRTQSAAGHFISGPTIPGYPRTDALLGAAPNIDFPLDRTERGDYHPSHPHA